MGEVTYFFDTYALIGLVTGSPNYAVYKSGFGILTTKLNLMELYYSLLKAGGVEEAERCYSLFSGFVVGVSDSLIKEAMLFKLKHRDKQFSYVDCIGYIIAARMGVRFLTGDRCFEGMQNVEFVR